MGVVRFQQLEGGGWTLEAEDGTVYDLLPGPGLAGLKDGSRVELTLRPLPGLMGTRQTGILAEIVAPGGPA